MFYWRGILSGGDIVRGDAVMGAHCPRTVFVTVNF